MKPLCNIVLILLFIFSITGIHAQKRTPSSVKKIEVKLLKIKRTTPSRVQSTEVVPKKVARLASKAEKQSWVKGHGSLPNMNIKKPSDAVLEHLILSARKPRKGKLGYLVLNDVHHVNFDGNMIVWNNVYKHPNLKGSLKVYLKLEKGKKYLVDFNVTCKGNTTFTLAYPGGTHDASYGQGTHHLVNILEAEKSGVILIKLSTTSDYWSFHQVEITQLD